jgi:hypothetical protein
MYITHLGAVDDWHVTVTLTTKSTASICDFGVAVIIGEIALTTCSWRGKVDDINLARLPPPATHACCCAGSAIPRPAPRRPSLPFAINQLRRDLQPLVFQDVKDVVCCGAPSRYTAWPSDTLLMSVPAVHTSVQLSFLMRPLTTMSVRM